MDGNIGHGGRRQMLGDLKWKSRKYWYIKEEAEIGRGGDKNFKTKFKNHNNNKTVKTA